ncbi:hypothetical protein F2Q69_00020473 [Brassica cretica]|uniref:Uncharacterized protein n=1 Tax=Brassica cretica TaxID=69181 RepID=A0A8S9Q057_BRACR|nr:hypothetical protein F2Q69_00020473 [Brassica cretica]
MLIDDRIHWSIDVDAILIGRIANFGVALRVCRETFPATQHYGTDLTFRASSSIWAEIEWHQAASKANSIASQIELLEEIIKAKGKFDFTAELEKLKEELMEADGMFVDVKVKVPDWCKLDEKWLLDE